MVFVPWGDHGICKFWMVRPDRCYNGDRCRFRHPAEADRGRLWDEQLAFQAKERHARNGTSSSQSESQVDRAGLEHIGKSLQQTMKRKRSPSSHQAEPSHDSTYDNHDSEGGNDFQSTPRYQHEFEHERHLLQTRSTQDSNIVHSLEIAGQSHAQTSGELSRAHQIDTHLGHRSRLSTSSRKFASDFDTDDSNEARNRQPKQTFDQVRENANLLPLGKRNRMLDYVSDEPRTSNPSARRSLPAIEISPSLNPEDQIYVQTSVGGGEVNYRRSGGTALSEKVEAPAATAGQLVRDQKHFNSPRKSLKYTLSVKMGATKRLSNGEAKVIGPHPSSIRVAAPYSSEAVLGKKLQPVALDSHDKSLAEAREESIKLQGVAWLDTTRRNLQLPIRTFTTACVYYHKFRLAHSGIEYNWADATAASLLTSCKVEDTLKKSKDILAAAYNAKASGLEQLGSDDPIFEGPSRVVIGLERLVLEAGGFDFRSRYPHKTMVKIARTLPASEVRSKIAKVAYTILTDMHRIFAPLKQTSATLALASLELAAHLAVASSLQDSSEVRDQIQKVDLRQWSTTREEIMETLLDALDLYTHHTTATILGVQYSLDDFLRVRLNLNKECTESSLPRHTTAPEPSLDRTSAVGATLRVANGHPTPVSPPQPDSQVQPAPASNLQSAPETTGTLRFMLDPQLAADEQSEVRRYFVEEWEEYDEEIEIPIPHPRVTSRERARERPRDLMDRRPVDLMDDRRGPPLPPAREERHRDRAIDRDRMRYERRYDDRTRRFDDRRDRRYDDRRYDDDRRRRDDRR